MVKVPTQWHSWRGRAQSYPERFNWWKQLPSTLQASSRLEGSLEPVFVELFLEVDHVSLLEAQLSGVLRLEVVESLENITHILPVRLCFTDQNVRQPIAVSDISIYICLIHLERLQGRSSHNLMPPQRCPCPMTARLWSPTQQMCSAHVNDVVSLQLSYVPIIIFDPKPHSHQLMCETI